MNKKILIANTILIALILIGDIFYIINGGLLLKGITSAGFVLMGLLNLAYIYFSKANDLKFSAIMFAGLFFAMLGDIILEIEFMVGAVLFAVGHLLFFFAYSILCGFKWKDLLFGAIIFIPSVLFITLAPMFNFGSTLMEIVCVIYAIIISIMVGKSISNLIQERNLKNIIILLGSILFFFSDLMLLLNIFASLGRLTGILCLATYYPAECLLAISIFLQRKNSLEFSEKITEEKVND